MTAKKLVQNFYDSDAFIDLEIMKTYLHSEIILDWNSSKGFIQMKLNDIINYTNELSIAYTNSIIRISHILQEGNRVSVRYSHFVKTIENPREEMLLAHFMVLWEVKDDKLFRGYQMSQLS